MNNMGNVEVIRLGENMLDIDGLKLIKKNDKWVSCSGERLGSVRIQALFLFLQEESIAHRQRFYKYVDKTINQLIYN